MCGPRCTAYIRLPGSFFVQKRFIKSRIESKLILLELSIIYLVYWKKMIFKAPGIKNRHTGASVYVQNPTTSELDEI